MSRTESFSLKAFAMAGVFACHCFDFINYWGFLFVSVFFFVSGYGLAGRNKTVLFRLPRLFVLWAFYLVIYALVRPFTFYLPHLWFLILYCLVLLFYRFVPGVFENFLFVVFCSLCFWLLDFNFVWWSSFIAFPFGLYVRKYGFPFSSFFSLFFFPAFFLLICGFPVRWLMVLAFISFLWHFRSFVSFLAPLGLISDHFYFIHFFTLYLCGVQLAPGSFSFPLYLGIPLALILSFSYAAFFRYFFSLVLKKNIVPSKFF